MPIVGPSRVGRAMLLLAMFVGISVAAVLYDEGDWGFLGETIVGNAPASIVRVGGSLAPLVVVSVTLMVLVVEGGTMVADAFRERLHERARRRGLEEGLERGLEQGLEQGRDEGLLRGRDEERVRWEQWLARKQEAEREHLPFDEPPPSED